MLDRIIHFSLHNKYLVLIIGVILMAVGLRTSVNMDVDVFPDLTAPTVVVMTDAHGMASEEVERLVTFPIETVVNGSTGVRRVRSASAQGFSFVWVEFDWGTDIYKARQVVSEKLIQISAQMPLGVSQPMLAPQSSIMGEIFFVGLQADSTSLMELRTLAEWSIKPLILSTGGVSQVSIIGGEYKQYQVLLDPEKMAFYGVGLNEVAEVCRGIGRNAPGGVVRQFGNEFTVRGIARTADLDELASTFIKMRGNKSIVLGDVAVVQIGAAPKMGTAAGNGEPAVIMAISKQPGTNTLQLTEAIETNLEALKTSLPPDVQLNTHIFRQADFIEASVNNVQKALIEGSIFVVIILFLFLQSFRTTIISLIAIPISLLGAVLVLNALGMSINTMSLGGMAIAIGSLVDDAIIDVENVYKRLRQNRQLPDYLRKSALMVVYDASREIRSSIFNATLIIMVAFVPLFFLSGMEGRMLQPLGISFLVALFVSLLVAMTLTPILAQWLLSDEAYLRKNEKDNRFVQTLMRAYTQSLTRVLNHRFLVLGSIIVLFIASLWVFSGLGRSFLPEFNEGSLTISLITQPGTSLDESDRIGSIVERELLSIPEVQSTARRTGRGELDEHSQATNSAELDVNFDLAERSHAEFMESVRQTLGQIPGIAFTVGQPLGHRIDHMLSGTRANIAIKIFGEDLPLLYQVGKEIESKIQGVEGLVDISVDQQIEVPQLLIRPDRERLARAGISMQSFTDFVEIAYGGEKMADIYENQRRFDLVVRFEEDYTSHIDGIKNGLIDTYDGRKIPLSEVAEVRSLMGPSTITRENVHRKLVVSANVAGRDLRSVVQDIQQEIMNHVALPEGYRIEYGGQFESEEKASRTLLLTSILAILVIFFLLYQEFRSFRLAGLILLNLPLALIGGILSVWITSGSLSIPAIIGFITLFGIATRNGILLVSNYQRLQASGTPLTETLIQGSADRLNAILMTALTAALALIPLALQGDLSGNEIQSPMAKVILGGLLSSTLLNIYILPVVYSFFNPKVQPSQTVES